MLVVDRVVLPSFDQPKQMRELERHGARVLDQRAQAGSETAYVRYMREDVIGCHEIGLAVAARDHVPCLGTEEVNLCSYALSSSCLSHVRCGFDAEYWYARRKEVLQEVAVVAGHFGHQAALG